MIEGDVPVQVVRGLRAQNRRREKHNDGYGDHRPLFRFHHNHILFDFSHYTTAFLGSLFGEVKNSLFLACKAFSVMM